MSIGKCEACGATKKLHFHHTNYEKDEGITVCARCHSILHSKKLVKKGKKPRRQPKKKEPNYEDENEVSLE